MCDDCAITPPLARTESSLTAEEEDEEEVHRVWGQQCFSGIVCSWLRKSLKVWVSLADTLQALHNASLYVFETEGVINSRCARARVRDIVGE